MYFSIPLELTHCIHVSNIPGCLKNIAFVAKITFSVIQTDLPVNTVPDGVHAGGGLGRNHGGNQFGDFSEPGNDGIAYSGNRILICFEHV